LWFLGVSSFDRVLVWYLVIGRILMYNKFSIASINSWVVLKVLLLFFLFFLFYTTAVILKQIQSWYEVDYQNRLKYFSSRLKDFGFRQILQKLKY
jgi:hypothetical protein